MPRPALAPAPTPRSGRAAAPHLPLLLLLLLLALVSAARSQPCAPPYASIASFDVRVAPGTARSFPTGWAIPAGQVALVEGDVTITGGVTVNGTLYLSSSSPSRIAADWIAVGAGGRLIAGSEACPVPTSVVATLELRAGSVHPNAGLKALAVLPGGTLELHGAKGLDAPWARLADTAPAGAASITLDAAPAPGSWSPGDEIAIASTDYDPYQTERVKIAAVSGSRVDLAAPLRFKHYGRVTMGVDQRAEVALLARSIRVVGAKDTPGLGCHSIFYENFTAVHVEGVEFDNCGQTDSIGRYPVHFHMAARVPAGTYVRAASIHDSNFRAVTLHGTQGVLVERCAAVEIPGHAYFLEDGAEWDNTLRGNLGMLVRAKTTGARLGSDQVGDNGDLSVFWITNPNNTFENNAAAATEGWGWFVHTRLSPRGLSKARWPGVRPSETPLRRFAGNSAHSVRLCIEMEADAVDAGDSPPVDPNSPPANWQPKNPDGSWAETLISGFTCHHAWHSGFWSRMGGVRMKDTAWADSTEAVQFATTGQHVSPPGTSFLVNATLVGLSDNTGDPQGDARFQRWDARLARSQPRVQDQSGVACGLKLYDGPLMVDGFSARSWPTGTAPISVRSNNAFQMAALSSIKGFSSDGSSYRFLNPDSSGDGGRTTSMRDLDGSISGYPGATLLPRQPGVTLGYYSSPGCASHPAYGLACPQQYINLEIGAWDWSGGGQAGGVTLTRTNLSPGNVGASGLAAQRLALAGNSLGPKSGRGGRYFNAATAVGAGYLLSWSGTGAGTPSKAFAQCSGCQLGDELEVVFCYPPGTAIPAASVTRGSIEFISGSVDAGSEAAPALGSLAEMRAATSQGTRFYYSQANGLLYIRLRQVAGWGGATPSGYCPPGGCSWAVVSLPAGAAAAPAAADCEARLASEPGAAPSDAANDPVLSAKLAAPRFSLASACPQTPLLPICDCWGWTGCGNRECSAAERQPCDASAANPGPPPVNPSPTPSPSPAPSPSPSASPKPSPSPGPSSSPKPSPAPSPVPSPSPSPSPSPQAYTGNCTTLSAAGACCAASCFAQANPNIGGGVSFLEYAASCLSGGLGCLGSNNGCRFCRLAKATSQLHLPLCAACVCQQYGQPLSQCDAGGAFALQAAPAPSPSPSPKPSPSLSPSPKPSPSPVASPKPSPSPSPSPKPSPSPSPSPKPSPTASPSPKPSPSPSPATSSSGANCTTLSAAGACCAASCFAQANPNIGGGVSFLEYAASCLSGGLGCLGSNNGCRFCRLAMATSQLHLPLCAACVCQQYGQPLSQCDPNGAFGPTPTPSPSPSASPKPSPAPSPKPSPSPAASPKLSPSPSPSPKPSPTPSPKPSPSPSPSPSPAPGGWGDPILVETFDGGALNRSLFDVEVDCWGGGNNEKQCYVDRPENVRVEGGRLILEARRGTYTGSAAGCTNNNENSCGWTRDFTSGRVRTKLSPYGSWKYGRFEVRAKLPRGNFLWPAIWMLPTDSVYGVWAASGEIDIMEARGQASLADVVEGTLHYGASWPNNVFRGSGRTHFPGVDFTAGFHDFALEWTADAATGRPKLMRWMVDGTAYYQRILTDSFWTSSASPYTQNGQPWDQKFHLILNVAVGGGFFPAGEFGGFGSAAEYDAAVTTWTSPRLEVEHVKVWAWPPKA